MTVDILPCVPCVELLPTKLPTLPVEEKILVGLLPTNVALALALKTTEVLPNTLVAFSTFTSGVVAVPTSSAAKLFANVKLDELVPPDNVVLVAPMVKPCPDVVPTLFSKVTLLPVVSIVNPDVLPPLTVPFKAIEPVVFSTSPVLVARLPVNAVPAPLTVKSPPVSEVAVTLLLLPVILTPVLVVVKLP